MLRTRIPERRIRVISFREQAEQQEIARWQKTHKSSSAEKRFTQHYSCPNTQELFNSLTKMFPNIEATKIEQAIYQDNKYYHRKAGVNWPPDDGKCHSEEHNFCESEIKEPAQQYITKVVKSLTNNPFESFATPKLQELSLRLFGIDRTVTQRREDLNKALEEFPTKTNEEELNAKFESLKQILTLKAK